MRVLDCLKATIHDVACVGAKRTECVVLAANVIATVTYPGEDDSDEEISMKNGIAVIEYDHDGIDIFIRASEEYVAGEK